MVLSIFGACCQKGGRRIDSLAAWLGSPQGLFNFCNEHLVCNNFIRLTIVMHAVMA
jgi:hypothetical protein